MEGESFFYAIIHLYELEYFDAAVEEFKIGVDVAVPHGHDFIVDECGEHLTLQEAAQEWPMVLLLIGQKWGFIEILQRFTIS